MVKTSFGLELLRIKGLSWLGTEAWLNIDMPWEMRFAFLISENGSEGPKQKLRWELM